MMGYNCKLIQLVTDGSTVINDLDRELEIWCFKMPLNFDDKS